MNTPNERDADPCRPIAMNLDNGNAGHQTMTVSTLIHGIGTGGNFGALILSIQNGMVVPAAMFGAVFALMFADGFRALLGEAK